MEAFYGNILKEGKKSFKPPLYKTLLNNVGSY
jgi:hypothetical protein